MSKRMPMAVMMILAMALPAAARPVWSLHDNCGTSRSGEYKAFESMLRSAQVGSRSYLPKPFPRSDAEVISDFEFGLRHGLSEPLSSSDRLLFEAMEAHQVKYRITEVADWSPLHCGRREPRPSYYLLQVFVEGRELTRATVSPSGLIGGVVNWSDGGPFKSRPPALPPDPEELPAESGQSLPEKAHDFQYVSLWGTVRCDDLIPCVAFRSGSDIYLWWRQPARNRSALYKVDVRGPRYLQSRDMGSPQAKVELFGRFHDTPRELVTLGGDEMVEVIEVHGDASN